MNKLVDSPQSSFGRERSTCAGSRNARQAPSALQLRTAFVVSRGLGLPFWAGKLGSARTNLGKTLHTTTHTTSVPALIHSRLMGSSFGRRRARLYPGSAHRFHVTF